MAAWRAGGGWAIPPTRSARHHYHPEKRLTSAGRWRRAAGGRFPPDCGGVGAAWGMPLNAATFAHDAAEYRDRVVRGLGARQSVLAPGLRSRRRLLCPPARWASSPPPCPRCSTPRPSRKRENLPSPRAHFVLVLAAVRDHLLRLRFAAVCLPALSGFNLVTGKPSIWAASAASSSSSASSLHR